MISSLNDVLDLMHEKYGNNHGEWREFDLNNPPEYQGLYAIYDWKDEVWFYCGRSQNIKKRFLSPSHPIHIAKSLDRKMSVFCVEVSERLNGSENILIRRLCPIGNGSTSFGGFSRYLPNDYRRFHPYAVTAPGPWCVFVNQGDMEEVWKVLDGI